MTTIKTQICCLKGVGSGTKRKCIIPLEKDTEVTMGRGLDVTAQIVDMSNTMISRKHCILRKNDQNHWTILDNKSLNGVFINGERLKPHEPYTLKESDLVQLGVSEKTGEDPPYVWCYRTKFRVKKIKGEANAISNSNDSSQSSDRVSSSQKRKWDDEAKPTTSKSEGFSPAKRVCPSTVWSPTAEMKKKMAEQERSLNEKLAAQEAKLLEMQAALLQKEAAQEKLQKELKEKEEQMKKDMQKQQEELERQKLQHEEEMKKSIEDQIRDKEESLQKKLEEERLTLISEKKRVEESLKTELEAKLGEKDKVLQEQLENERSRLEKVIQKKECEQKLLTAELEKAKAEKEKHKDDVWKTKEDILSNFTGLMETELQCGICNEMFIEATSLGCKHSYCSYCIEEWSRVKRECPICRAPIAQKIRSIALDNYIEKMTEQLTDEMRKKRKELINERKEEQQQKEEERAAARGRGRAGGRRRGRGGRRRGGARARGRRARANTQEHVIQIESEGEGAENEGEVLVLSGVGAEEEVITLSDAHVSSDSSDSEPHSPSEPDSDESIDGIPGVYYGGYGHCYICGHRGHWANGCPFD